MSNETGLLFDVIMKGEESKFAPEVGDKDVNSPQHYTTNGLETIELISLSMSSDEFKGYLKGNILKYVCRYRHKHQAEPKKDLLKAQWYLNRLLKEW